MFCRQLPFFTYRRTIGAWRWCTYSGRPATVQLGRSPRTPRVETLADRGLICITDCATIRGLVFRTTTIGLMVVVLLPNIPAVSRVSRTIRIV